jgi:hypothetical protein
MQSKKRCPVITRPYLVVPIDSSKAKCCLSGAKQPRDQISIIIIGAKLCCFQKGIYSLQIFRKKERDQAGPRSLERVFLFCTFRASTIFPVRMCKFANVASVANCNRFVIAGFWIVYVEGNLMSGSVSLSM